MPPRPAIHRRPGFSAQPLTGGGRGFKEAGSRDPTDRAQVAELVDALASGASGLTAVKVRVLSWAPLPMPMILQKFRAGLIRAVKRSAMATMAGRECLTVPETATARSRALREEYAPL